MDGQTENAVLDRLRRLLDVGRSMVAELEPEAVLTSVLEAARDITGARYAALGVLNQQRDALERFLTVGIDEETHRLIGDLPQGHGVLGVLISDPRPLRLDDVGMHPRSYGFPPGHPPMRTFLGVPLRVRDQVYGNLYLTDKADGEFDVADEEAVVVLAEWAGIAIHNARLYREATEHRDELQRAVSAFEGSLAVARAVGGETDLDRILELIVKRGRALVDARSMFVALANNGELTINAVAGELDRGLQQRAVPVSGSPVAEVMELRRPKHLGGGPDAAPCSPVEGVFAGSALMVPLVYRGRAVGVLCAIDPMSGSERFSKENERVLEAFATSGATAVATGQNVAEQRLKRGIEASESERRRWARELHDETLQDLASLKLILSSARRSKDPAAVGRILDEAVEQLTDGIAALRHLINDLRPPALDDSGLQAAIEAVVARVAGMNGIDAELDVDLAFERGEQSTRLSTTVEDTLYRVVQEALTNVVKHANASSVEISILERGDRVEVRVVDDGVGIDLGDGRTAGFGLIGIEERLELVGGAFTIEPIAEGGTELRAYVPAVRRDDVSLERGSAP